MLTAPRLTSPAVALCEKVAFLSSGAAYPHAPERVEARETHMSWIFLTGALVYKLKKPVRYSFLDFSTLEARQQQCTAELRLNRRLAGETYRRVVPLCRESGGRLAIDGTGEIVDWLVEMAQLPAADMLDTRLRSGEVSHDEVVALGEALARFYVAARPQIRDGRAYPAHFEKESRINRELLMQPRFGVSSDQTCAILDKVDTLLRKWAPAISARIADGRIVEGHGDLRPEHVCLGHPPRIIDCLEFNRGMRLLDPYDEVNYLGLECAFLGADWIRPILISALERLLGGKPEPGLLCAYGAFRAALRARICIAHLLDPEPSEPERWPGEALRYLAVAEDACLKAGD